MKKRLLLVGLLPLALGACDTSDTGASGAALPEIAAALNSCELTLAEKGWFGPEEHDAVVQKLPVFLAAACASPGSEVPVELCRGVDA
jgi:hypothetical protein